MHHEVLHFPSQNILLSDLSLAAVNTTGLSQGNFKLYLPQATETSTQGKKTGVGKGGIESLNLHHIPANFWKVWEYELSGGKRVGRTLGRQRGGRVAGRTCDAPCHAFPGLGGGAICSAIFSRRSRRNVSGPQGTGTPPLVGACAAPAFRKQKNTVVSSILTSPSSNVSVALTRALAFSALHSATRVLTTFLGIPVH